MRNEGMIFLYGSDGELVDGGRYSSPGHRREAIEKWKRRYAKGYEKCFIQISPETNEYLVRDEDGKNIKRTYENPHGKQKGRIRKKKISVS